MAVELKCPECRAKLRLPSEPEPGTEIECPKCSHVFPAPDLDTGEVPDNRSRERSPRSAKKDRPALDREKKSADTGTEKSEKKSDSPVKSNQPRRRKAKKKETNKTMLFTLIGVGVFCFVSIIILLAWYFMRKPAAYEMATYLPADCTTASGLNIGHINKYPEFLKKFEPSYMDFDLKKVTDIVAKALGGDTNTLVDYMMQGTNSAGMSFVIRTKKDFDKGSLVNIPGARESIADGYKYYLTGQLASLSSARVYAPSSRIVVVCPGNISDATFKKLLTANSDNRDETLVGKLSGLTTIMKGTFWVIGSFDDNTRPKPPPKIDNAAGGSDAEPAFRTQVAKSATGAKGYGFKASLGSRAIRFEVAVLFQDSDKATELYKAFKESNVAKGDEAEPDKWWKGFTTSYVSSNKKVALELLSNLKASSSGSLFSISSECDTKLIMDILGSLVSRITGGYGNAASNGPTGMGMGPDGGSSKPRGLGAPGGPAGSPKN